MGPSSESGREKDDPEGKQEGGERKEEHDSGEKPEKGKKRGARRRPDGESNKRPGSKKSAKQPGERERIPRMRTMKEDAPRFGALWNRLEALVTATIEMFWREAQGAPGKEGEPPGKKGENAESAAPESPDKKRKRGGESARAGGEEASQPAGEPVKAFRNLYPPEVERPLRAGPLPKDLANVVACLRRIQDARFALDSKSTGEESNEQDDDEESLGAYAREAYYRRLQSGALQEERETDGGAAGG